MSLETAITKAWQRQALWLWLLLPLSWLYGLLSLIRRQGYKLGWLQSYRAPIPVMVIGNITVGGSGKTPLIMALVDYLQQHKLRVGVISRG
ncbi:tetraacyldisaccharide 4'-kinase, partial [Psychrobacter urativorans]|uniref:tetraacyldisaccharide 4'-kinase n=2 Tax=Psychrobacter TaxID=497 RepID=UPI003BB49CDE